MLGVGRRCRAEVGGVLRAGPAILLSLKGGFSEYDLVIQLGIFSNPGTWKANIKMINIYRIISTCKDLKNKNVLATY